MRRPNLQGLLLAITAALLATAFAAPLAQAGPRPVTGADYTTVNEAVDGPGRCFNGNPGVNCNQYTAKRYVWLNGGPPVNGIGPNGLYFFAVLAPGGQPDPNDGGPKNLSDDFDAYTNRTFTITNGEVSAYAGTHDLDSGAPPGPRAPNGQPPMIRLWPFADMTNPGGVYIMAICYLGADAASTVYPVNPSTCKYDAFKAPHEDVTPPICVLAGIAEGPPKQLFVSIQDLESGIESITYEAVNATVTIPTFDVGALGPMFVTATKVDQSKSSFFRLTVRNTGGLVTVCDPVIPAVKKKARPQPLRAGVIRAGGLGVRSA